MEMKRIENTLSRLETNLRSIIEGGAARGGLPRRFYNHLIHELAKAMKDGRRFEEKENRGEAFVAPDQYTLILPEKQARELLSHPVAIDRLSRKLDSLASHEKILLSAPPIIRIVASPEASEIKVMTEYSHIGMGDSYTTELDGLQVLASEEINQKMPNAFLIVNGVSTYPLSQSVINIGRDPSNTLVLKNPSISRMHAQLRLNNEHFIIFDLDSTSGTFVNGVAVSSHALNPGDVIMLAGVPLVYGQEQGPRRGHTQELQAFPLPPEVL